MIEQCTVKSLKKILDDLSAEGHDNMPIFLGDKTPLLTDSIHITYRLNSDEQGDGVFFKNTYYDKELAKNADELKNAIDVAIKKYVTNCYHAGKDMEEL